MKPAPACPLPSPIPRRGTALPAPRGRVEMAGARRSPTGALGPARSRACLLAIALAVAAHGAVPTPAWAQTPSPSAASAPAGPPPASAAAAQPSAKAAAPAPAAPGSTGAAAASTPSGPGLSGQRAGTDPTVDKRLVPMRGGDPAAPAHAADQQPGRPPVRLPDPMDRLRERLAQRMGATQAAPGTAQTPPVMRVDNQARGEITIDGGRARVVSPRARDTVGQARGRAHGAAPAPADKAPPKAWSYQGQDTGPDAWARLHRDFALCGQGQRQSPIDIREGIAVDLAPIQFLYKPGFFSVIDTGHAIEVQTAAGNAIEVGTQRFELQAFHFHHPGEGKINGTAFPMSIHLLHKDAKGQPAVVVLLAENWSDDAEHPVVQQVWNHLPLEKGQAVPAPVEIDPSGLLPTRRGYFTFMGSLTTPPCTEGVLWIVMQQTIPVSKAQIAILARLYPMNARPVQPLNGRLIKQSR